MHIYFCHALLLSLKIKKRIKKVIQKFVVYLCAEFHKYGALSRKLKIVVLRKKLNIFVMKYIFQAIK